MKDQKRFTCWANLTTLTKPSFSYSSISLWNSSTKNIGEIKLTPEKISGLNGIFEPMIPPRGGGVGYFTKFYTGRLCPEVQPLTLSYTILADKVPLIYTFYKK